MNLLSLYFANWTKFIVAARPKWSDTMQHHQKLPTDFLTPA